MTDTTQYGFSPGGNGCCCRVGWMGDNELTGCLCVSVESLYLLSPADLVTAITPLKVIFCQNVTVGCSDNNTFSAAQYSAISAWVHAGGRLWVNGEYEGCISPTAKSNMNAFLAAVGSSMQLGGHTCNCLCLDVWLGVNGPAKIVNKNAAGATVALPGVYHECTGEITGGTVISNTTVQADMSDGGACQTSFPWLAIEAVGSGFVIASGDGNIFGSCDTDNCELFTRYLHNADGDLV